eukprot:697731-Rhodomonas_salina.1
MGVSDRQQLTSVFVSEPGVSVRECERVVRAYRAHRHAGTQMETRWECQETQRGLKTGGMCVCVKCATEIEYGAVRCA